MLVGMVAPGNSGSLDFSIISTACQIILGSPMKTLDLASGTFQQLKALASNATGMDYSIIGALQAAIERLATVIYDLVKVELQNKLRGKYNKSTISNLKVPHAERDVPHCR